MEQEGQNSIDIVMIIPSLVSYMVPEMSENWDTSLRGTFRRRVSYTLLI